MMKSPILFGLAVGLIAAADASAQSKVPDALYEDARGVYKQFENFRVNSDSLTNSFSGSHLDSIKVNADGSITGYGIAPYGSMQGGTLLDNRSESDSYFLNGTRYYIRNAKPKIEAREVVPGSNVYKLK